MPLVAVVTGLYVYATGGQEVETDNAYVKANIVPISAAVTGRVIEVLARDNRARRGRGACCSGSTPCLIRSPWMVRVRRWTWCEPMCSPCARSTAQPCRKPPRRRSRIDFLEKQLERQERLKEKGMTRGDTYDEARHNVEAARRRLDSVREKTNRVIAELVR